MSTTLSCGQCGAPLRADQDWCALCFALVEPSFDPLTAPLEEVVGRTNGAEPSEPSAAGPRPPEHPLDPEVFSHPAEPTEIAPTAMVEVTQPTQLSPAVSDVDVMLSMLAAEHRQNDPAAGLAERLGDKSTRIAVMVGGMVLIGGVGFLLLTVLGAIF